MKYPLLKNIAAKVLAESELERRRELVEKLREVAEFIKENCQIDALFDVSGIPLYYRGIRRFEEPITQVNPAETERRSKDSNNVSLTFFSTSNAWKHIPRRNRSAIFGNSTDIARDYGSPFAIFPIGNPMVGFGGARDNYDNFSKGFRSLSITLGESQIGFDRVAVSVEDVDNLIRYVSYGLFGMGTINLDGNQEATLNAMEEMETKLKELNALEEPQALEMLESHRKVDDKVKWFYLFIRQAGGLFELLEKIYNPTLNGIRAVPLTDIPVMGDAEFWTEGKCILIEFKLLKAWRQFHEYLKGEIDFERYLDHEISSSLTEGMIEEGPATLIFSKQSSLQVSQDREKRPCPRN